MKILIATERNEQPGWVTELPRILPLSPGVTVRVLALIEVPTPAFTSLTPWARRAYGAALAGWRREEEAAVERSVEAVRHALNQPIEVVRALVKDGRPARKIVEEAEAWQADLVVLGASGATKVRQLLLGSVDLKVARHAPCAVLVARGREAEQKACGSLRSTSGSLCEDKTAR